MKQPTTEIISQANAAQKALLTTREETVNQILSDVAQSLRSHRQQIEEANQKDLSSIEPSSHYFDRAQLTPERIESLAQSLETITTIPSEYKKTVYRYEHPKGFMVQKRKYPFGTVGVIYESRPNVTIDLFAMALKSRNALVLKGGKEVAQTNRLLVELIQSVVASHSILPEVIGLLEPTRESTTELITAKGSIDLVIPRGGTSLIEYVVANATVPVIETGTGVVHTYYDGDGDREKALPIILNAKTRRPSVCNSLDTLIVHQNKQEDLPAIRAALTDAGVTIHEGADCNLDREFLGMQMNIIVVEDFEEAIALIGRHSTGHSESIITENEQTATRFMDEIDAACVYHNLPTSFSDGGEFGLGGEIGISTQKLHARGPMFFNDLLSYQWIATGNGQTR
jgi:glutamate-5-semialdehyde dehydrogenase